MRYLSALVLVMICLTWGTAADKAESAQVKIARAVSAAPANIGKDATVMEMDEKGNTTVLRKGTNGFTCFAGHPGTVGDDPFCADQPSMQWIKDWMAHKPKPTNTQPGIIYMLAGGSDWSATDPWAASGKPIKEPPHWMIMWPFESGSGLTGSEKQNGTWIMWAGTPYAHLMINQKP